jgi:DNA-binding transcriptional MerR regulator
MGNDYILTGEAAELLDRSSECVRGYEKSGKLPALKTSHGVRLFSRGDVLALRAELAKRERRGA